MKRLLTVFAVLAIAAGCTTSKPAAAPDTSTAPPAMSAAPTTAAPTSSAPADGPKTSADLVIGFGTLGPASIGMSKKAALATGLFDADAPAPVDGCPSPPLTWKGPFKQDVDVLTTESGAIASLGVHRKGPKTEAGVEVGSTLADLKHAYGDNLTKPVEAGYGQTGTYVEKDGAWIGFLLDPAPAAVKDDSTVTFIEVSRSEKPGLMRDGC